MKLILTTLFTFGFTLTSSILYADANKTGMGEPGISKQQHEKIRKSKKIILKQKKILIL